MRRRPPTDERGSPRAGVGECGELGLRSRDDDLAGTVDVRGRQAHFVAGGDDGIGISAGDAHARRRAGAASAIADPRSRTNTIACSAVSTPAPTAAVISPTEWPAPAPIAG